MDVHLSETKRVVYKPARYRLVLIPQHSIATQISPSSCLPSCLSHLHSHLYPLMLYHTALNNMIKRSSSHGHSTRPNHVQARGTTGVNAGVKDFKINIDTAARAIHTIQVDAEVKANRDGPFKGEVGTGEKPNEANLQSPESPPDAISLQNKRALISSLPDILLLAIFHASSETSLVVTAIQASQVIQRWRTLSITTPTLWTDIGVTATLSPFLLRSVLTRSQGMLVDIRLYYDSKKSVYLRVAQHVYILKAHVEQWRTLRVRIRRRCNLDSLLRIFEGLCGLYAPYLELLHVQSSVPSKAASIAGGYILPLLSAGAPALREVAFENTLIPVQIQMDNLTDLTLYLPRTTATTEIELVGLLYNTPHLVELRLRIKTDNTALLSGVLRAGETVPLSFLKTLAVHCDNKKAVSSILLALDTPVLRTLMASPMDVPMLTRRWACYPSTRVIVLAHVPSGALLSVFPNFESGTFWFMKHLGAITYIPKVTKLELHTTCPNDERTLREFISARVSLKYPITELKIVEMEGQFPISEVFKEWLRANVEKVSFEKEKECRSV